MFLKSPSQDLPSPRAMPAQFLFSANSQTPLVEPTTWTLLISGSLKQSQVRLWRAIEQALSLIVLGVGFGRILPSDDLPVGCLNGMG